MAYLHDNKKFVTVVDTDAIRILLSILADLLLYI